MLTVWLSDILVARTGQCLCLPWSSCRVPSHPLQELEGGLEARKQSAYILLPGSTVGLEKSFPNFPAP